MVGIGIECVSIYMDIYLGKGLIQKDKVFNWSPDSPESLNPHFLLTGKSGAGKTSKIKQIIEDLGENGKIVFVLDFHGDMATPGENHIEYTARNSPFGINPFEFETDLKNGGPSINVANIVQMFKKNFWPNMGALQQSVLKNLLNDTYKFKGIFDEKPETWPDESNSEKLPTMQDLYQVFTMILNLQNGEDDICKHFFSISNELYTYRQKADATDKDKTKERHENSISERQKDFEKAYENFYNYIFNGTEEIEEGAKEANKHNIDLTLYENKKSRAALESLEPYIRDLADSNIFNQAIPKLIRGVNRFDISGFTNMAKPDMALFFADNWVQRIFRKAKMQGEVNLEKDGVKTKTFIVMDESRIVLPTGKDKSNPYHILNKVALEARKYGLGLVLGSQRASHFSSELLTSFYTKLILQTDPADVKSTAEALGINKRDIGYFETIDKKQGAGLLIRAGKVIPLSVWER